PGCSPPTAPKQRCWGSVRLAGNLMSGRGLLWTRPELSPVGRSGQPPGTPGTPPGSPPRLPAGTPGPPPRPPLMPPPGPPGTPGTPPGTLSTGGSASTSKAHPSHPSNPSTERRPPVSDTRLEDSAADGERIGDVRDEHL